MPFRWQNNSIAFPSTCTEHTSRQC